MDLWKSLSGMVELELLCPDCGFALKKITEAGISVYRVAEGSYGFGLRLSINRGDFRALSKLANKYGYECVLRRHKGLYWDIKQMIRRPVLIAGMLLFFVLSLYLPSRVLFFQVEGNERIPEKQILQECENAGVGFGSHRAQVRSERVKNALLEAIPNLKWVGVNTRGCVAVITVQERWEDPKQSELGISSIVASRDGVITSCTASKGNLLVKPGQAVTAGEVLISGYTDCGLSIRATRSEGEVYAQTNREITTVFPSSQQVKGEIIRETKKYGLIIGKKRINFYKDSGILGDSCDKMVTNHVLTLPGGFQLPVALVEERWIFREQAEMPVEQDDALQWMQEASLRYLRSVMIAGSVRKITEEDHNTDERFALNTKYFCHEMIGQVQNEENLQPYGK